ncbi:MAG TPA: nitroreductase family deazaflavin-dependent oxidoreductase [Acidimicrobiales bacterium]|nr:nitroreductase family deazaflavin-dependent oxidoreductase [Acidimicrobiales bacterium]
MPELTDFNTAIIEEFRANHGQVGGGFQGAPVVLLTTTGARSGTTRVNPLVCLPGEDGTLYVFASKGGAPTNPDWYYNLLAHPKVEVEFGEDAFAAIASPLTGTERDEIFSKQKERFPAFAEYEKRAGRQIPVIALTHIARKS